MLLMGRSFGSITRVYRNLGNAKVAAVWLDWRRRGRHRGNDGGLYRRNRCCGYYDVTSSAGTASVDQIRYCYGGDLSVVDGRDNRRLLVRKQRVMIILNVGRNYLHVTFVVVIAQVFNYVIIIVRKFRLGRRHTVLHFRRTQHGFRRGCVGRFRGPIRNLNDGDICRRFARLVWWFPTSLLGIVTMSISEIKKTNINIHISKWHSWRSSNFTSYHVGYDANTSARGWARKSNFETTSGGIPVRAVARLFFFFAVSLFCLCFYLLFQRCWARTLFERNTWTQYNLSCIESHMEELFC